MDLTDFLIKTNIDFRKLENRLLGMKIYYAGQRLSWDIDPAYPFINYVIDRWNLTKEQAYWISWCYGHTYSEPATYWIFKHFPNYQKIKISDFEKWHNINCKHLLYGNDNKYNKGYLIQMFKDYKNLVGSNQTEYFMEKSFETVWQDFIKLFKIGRYQLWFYLETLKRCLNHNYNPIDMIWKNAWSPRHAILHIIDRFDLIGKKDKNTIDLVESQSQKFLKEIKKEMPRLGIDLFYWETSLCAYRGHFERHRYLGYYIDRQQHSIQVMEDRTKNHFDLLWDFRKNILWHEFLGEFNNYDGIRKNLLNYFADTGHLAMLDVLIKKNYLNEKLELKNI